MLLGYAGYVEGCKDVLDTDQDGVPSGPLAQNRASLAQFVLTEHTLVCYPSMLSLDSTIYMPVLLVMHDNIGDAL